MIKKNTFILFLISLILVIFFVVIQQFDWFNKINDDRKAATPTQSLWLDIQLPQISKITYKMVGQDDVIIQRMSGTDWRLNNGGESITSGKIEELVSELNAIRPLLFLAENPDSTATGLINPDKILLLELNEGTLITIKIGSVNPLQTGYYAQMDFTDIVLISKGSVENIVSIFTAALSSVLLEKDS